MQPVYQRRSILASILSQTFSAMRHPNYRMWFFGLLISSIGGWMQSTAQQYLIFELTGSSTYLGFVGFVNGIPSWIFMLLGGLVADRFARQKVLLITQISLMLLALVMAGLIFTNSVQPWHILVLAFILGFVNAFDLPARSAFLVELVGLEDLTNAIALNSMVFNAAVIIGPAIAGIIYALVGPGWCFVINAVSFIAVLITLIIMRLPSHQSQPDGRSVLAELKEGVVYTLSDKTIRTLIGNIGYICIFSFGVMTLLPVWAKDYLGGDSRTYGLLLSGRGIGAVIGSLIIAALATKNIRGAIWTVGSVGMPLVLFLFPQVRTQLWAIGAMIGFGWCVMALVNTTNSLIQLMIPDHLRGRVMSVYNMVFMGSLPIGSLLNGTAATWIGESTTIMGGSLLMGLFAVSTFLFWPEMRKLE